MKHLKTYESIEDDPKIGDYVICTDNGVTNDNKFEYYLNSNIGQIIKIDKSNIRNPYEINYENTPEEFLKYANSGNNIKCIFFFNRKEIKYFSKNKKELEYIISANKYNI